MHPILKQYKILVEFLGQVLGPNYEITLHDLSGKKNELAAIVNGHISGRTVGAPLTDLALRFVVDKAYETHDFEVNYRGTSKKTPNIRSSTMFIKDNSGKLLGMLCINFDASQCLDLIEKTAALFQIDMAKHVLEIPKGQGMQEENHLETFSASISDLVQSALEGIEGSTSIPTERLTQDEKMQVVDELSQKGVFLLKGAVSEVAEQLCCSEASIYRYLSKLNKLTRM